MYVQVSISYRLIFIIFCSFLLRNFSFENGLLQIRLPDIFIPVQSQLCVRELFVFLDFFASCSQPVWPIRYYILNARFFLPPTPVVDTHTHTHTHAHTPPPHRYAHTHTLTHLSVPQSWIVVIIGLLWQAYSYIVVIMGLKVSSIRKFQFGKSAPSNQAF